MDSLVFPEVVTLRKVGKARANRLPVAARDEPGEVGKVIRSFLEAKTFINWGRDTPKGHLMRETSMVTAHELAYEQFIPRSPQAGIRTRITRWLCVTEQTKQFPCIESRSFS